jgi:hypothetical protein
VEPAEIRFPLQVQDTWRLPCDIYLADLKAIESKGLTFDPITKNSIRGEEGWSKGASAVYAVGPNHRWLTFSHRGGSSRVLADGKQIYSVSVWSRQTNDAKVAIPKGTGKIRIEFSGNVLNRAGLTLGPRAARAQVCLAGMNPAEFKPLVYTSSGKRVGCDIIWGSDGEPMTVLFDCSNGEKDYFLYPVDKRHNLADLPWKRAGGMILETQYFDRYDVAVETFEGFNKLWNQPDRIAGRIIVRRPFITSLPPFAPMHSSRLMFSAPHGAPLVLSRCSGVVHIPDSGNVRIYSRFRSGGYVLINGKLSSWNTQRQPDTGKCPRHSCTSPDRGRFGLPSVQRITRNDKPPGRTPVRRFPKRCRPGRSASSKRTSPLRRRVATGRPVRLFQPDRP